MFTSALRKLLNEGFISEDQFEKIDPIVRGRIVSVFYELRVLLYLGIILFTTGIAILIYDNINEWGHLVAVSLLFVATAFLFGYIFKFGKKYSHAELEPPTVYFDYIVLLSALLMISVIGYLEFLYEIFEVMPGSITLVTAGVFFFLAYRFDNVSVLSLAISAFASFWSITISPQKWYHGDFGSVADLYNVAIIFSCSLATCALILDRRKIKPHFTFTYLNFSALIFFVAAISGLFINEWYLIYLLLIYAGGVFAFYMARWRKSFLFLLYAFVATYIGTTYLLADLVFDNMIELWFIYSILSCGGFIFFIIRYRTFFRQKA